MREKGLEKVCRNLTKDRDGFYKENYEILMEEIEDNTKEMERPHIHELEKSILLKCPFYPRLFTYSMQSP
jgi:hypothetical protein